MKKLKKFIKSPGVFFRDYFNKRYPIVRNEIQCPELEENVLIKHNLAIENLLPINFPIDVVFTWVDDSDIKWKEKYKNYKSEVDIEKLGNFSTDNARFNNHDELRYSIKSIELYLPWVRNIFIITDNQNPLRCESNKKIKIIDHKEIIDDKYLPTFNSHVIEAHLHKVPNLAEHFIYFNDDVFVARPLPPGHFFKSNGLSSLFISRKSLKNMSLKGTETPTLSASTKSAKIFDEDFNINIDTPLVHTYVPLQKSFFELAWKEYETEITLFLSNKFRTNNDINMATFFVPWLAYIKGKATLERDVCHYFNIRSKAARSYYKSQKIKKITGEQPHSFCANDFNSETANLDNYKEHLKEALEDQFNSSSRKK